METRPRGRAKATEGEEGSQPVEEGSKEYSLTIGPGLSIGLIFVASVGVLSLVLCTFPELDDDDVSRLKLPRDIDDAKDLGRLLSKYKNTHYHTVLAAMFATYVFLQTFAIPGSIFLSILSGFLFPFPAALLLVCTCSALGATFCYLLSAMVGQGPVRHYFPDRLRQWRLQAAKHQSDMMWYIIFLRITPFLPNWFINLASPIVGVRLTPFFWGTFVGVAPPSFFFIRAGTTLYELTTSTGHISLSSVMVLASLALLSLAPVLFKRLIARKNLER